MTKPRFSFGPIERVTGADDTPHLNLYRDTTSGIYFREFHIPTGKPGPTVELHQITDVHFNLCNDADLTNEELAGTVQCRHWLAGGASVQGMENVLPLLKTADCVVVTGDTLDYLSEGAMELTEKYIWGPLPEALLCLGGHELTRQMQTGKPDQTSLAERYETLRQFWHHDVSYVSRIVGDKAMVVCLDNSCGRYPDGTAERLAADLAKARADGLAVLLFQHEPIDTGKPEDEDCPTLWECDGKSYNFRKCIGSAARKTDDATAAVLRLIRANGDVIRGIFCGHLHSAYYTELPAEGGAIPQLVLEGHPYNGQVGHVLRILLD